MFWCICMCMHAYICVCMHACMRVWTFRSMYMCFHMYTDVCAHACVYVHFCNIPPQVLKLASLAPPPPLYWKASYAYEPSSNSWVTVWNTKLFYFHSLKYKRMQISATDSLKYHIWPRTPYREVIKHNKSPHTREPRGQPFPSRWPQDCNKWTTR